MRDVESIFPNTIVNTLKNLGTPDALLVLTIVNDRMGDTAKENWRLSYASPFDSLLRFYRGCVAFTFSHGKQLPNNNYLQVCGTFVSELWRKRKQQIHHNMVFLKSPLKDSTRSKRKLVNSCDGGDGTFSISKNSSKRRKTNQLEDYNSRKRKFSELDQSSKVISNSNDSEVQQTASLLDLLDPSFDVPCSRDQKIPTDVTDEVDKPKKKKR